MTTARLQAHHIADLRSSGLSEETIQASGCYSATEATVRELLGFGVGPGLVFPFPNTEIRAGVPFVQVKPDTRPDWMNGAKYLTPKGAGCRMYVPPTLDPVKLADPKVPLIVTEGCKKILRAVQEDLIGVAFAGVDAWRDKRGGKSAPISDLDRIPLRGRIVYEVYDSDLAIKPAVRFAEFRLARELTARGAKVYAVRLPEGPNGEKVGLDDYLCSHSVEAFCALPAVPVEHPATATEKAGPPARSLAQCFQSYLQDLRDPMPRIALGYPSLSRHHRGLARGEVCVILARTGVGKTAMAMNILERTAVKHQIPALFFSLEMSGEEITERILALSLGEPAHMVSSFARHAGSRIAEQASAALEPWGYVRVVDAPCRVKDIEAAVASHPDVRLVVIDYLGMIIPPRQGSLYEATSDLARSLKRIAGAHRVAMIVLAQIGRQGETGGVPVTLRDARDSGAIEEAANYVLGLWRPDLAEGNGGTPPEEGQPVELKARLLKNRSGPANRTVTLTMDLRTLRISDKDPGAKP